MDFLHTQGCVFFTLVYVVVRAECPGIPLISRHVLGTPYACEKTTRGAGEPEICQVTAVNMVQPDSLMAMVEQTCLRKLTFPMLPGHTTLIHVRGGAVKRVTRTWGEGEGEVRKGRRTRMGDGEEKGRRESKFHGSTPEKGTTKKVTTSSIFICFFPAIDSCDENRLRNT
jgi:hypothetical protein